MTEPSIIVTCEECSRTLDEPHDLAPERRSPCPCGSLERHVYLNVHDEVRAHEAVALKARHGDTGRPFREIKAGDDLHKQTGRWNVLWRLIDHDEDLYEERIIDGETGAVIRDVREPLSQHRGHGSAKHSSSS